MIRKGVYLGIDPGLKGGLVLGDSDAKAFDVAKMPINDRGLVDSIYIMTVILQNSPEKVFIEMSGTAGHVGANRAGVNYGRITGIIEAINSEVEIVEINPKKWLAAMGFTGKDKGPRIAFAERHGVVLPPAGKTARSKEKHDGIADAYCILYYGVMLHEK